MKPLALAGHGGSRVPLSHQPPLLSCSALTGGNKVRLALHLPHRAALRVPRLEGTRRAPISPTTPRATTPSRWKPTGRSIRAYVDGKLVLEASDPELLKGKAGVTAGGPGALPGFPRLDVRRRRSRQIAARIRAARGGTGAAARRQSQAETLEEVRHAAASAPGAMCASAIWMATASPDMLIAQNIPRVRGDAFDQISCLTAVTLDGKVLWQIGPARPAQRPADQRHAVPDPRYRWRRQERSRDGARFPTADSRRPHGRSTPIGVDAARCRPTDTERPYEMESGDSIAFVNFSGQQGPPRDSGQGPLHAFLDLQQQAGTAVEGRRPDRPLSVSGGPRRQGPRLARDRLFAVGPQRQETVESRHRIARSCRRHHGRQSLRRSRRPSRESTPAAATKASSCSTCTARS